MTSLAANETVSSLPPAADTAILYTLYTHMSHGASTTGDQVYAAHALVGELGEQRAELLGLDVLGGVAHPRRGGGGPMTYALIVSAALGGILLFLLAVASARLLRDGQVIKTEKRGVAGWDKITRLPWHLIDIEPYDIGGGQIRFAVVMVSNTGSAACGASWPPA